MRVALDHSSQLPLMMLHVMQEGSCVEFGYNPDGYSFAYIVDGLDVAAYAQVNSGLDLERTGLPKALARLDRVSGGR